MLILSSFSLPFTNPVLIFTLVLVIILTAPILLRKIRMPGIIGLIVAGVIIGPYGFHLLDRNAEIELFSTIGLLYLMFLVGLEIDLNDLKKSRRKSFFFGGLSFIFPMAFGFLTAYYMFDYSFITSLLVACMLSTHTLIAYPIVSKMGITKNEAITIAIGGTIVVETAVLVLLALISSSVQGDINARFWIELGASLLVFAFLILWGAPRLSKWFFSTIPAEGPTQYLFVLTIGFLSAVLAELLGIEPILGTFMAGLAMNRFVPHSSALMNRIEFIGNTIFVPFFLLKVGMMVDLSGLLQGIDILILIAVLIAIAIVSKYIPAFIIQKIYRLSVVERNIIFGLSTARAAATIAVVLVGYRLEVISTNLLNATVILILVTALISSLISEFAGRKIAQIESDKIPDDDESQDRILVPIANPANIERLIDLAILIKKPKSKEPIFPLSVVSDDEKATENVKIQKRILAKAVQHGSASEQEIELETRVDYNVANGIYRAITELTITIVVLGWNGKSSARNFLFGTILDNLLKKSEQMIMVSKIIRPCNTFERLVVAVPPLANTESGFGKWIDTTKILASQVGATLSYFGDQESIDLIKEIGEAGKPVVEAEYNEFDDWQDFLIFTREVKVNDLFVIVSSRKQKASYHSYLDNIPKKLSKYFENYSFIIIYPEQKATDTKVYL